MNGRLLFLILGMSAVILAGCASTQPPAGGNASGSGQQPVAPAKQYLCSDGVTIVTDLGACPQVDTELQDCERASSKSDYYGESDQDACYYNLAVDRGNISLCKKIHGTDSYGTYTQAKCGAELAVAEGDPKVCDSLGLISKADCYNEVATQTENPEVCLMISNGDKKDTCIYDYVLSNYYSMRDWSICDNISQGSYEASYCYQSAATTTESTSYCDKISGSGGIYSYSKAECYGTVAKDSHNPGLCERLSTTTDKDECYYEIATSYPYDQSQCGKIVDQGRKGDCNYYTNRSGYIY